MSKPLVKELTAAAVEKYKPGPTRRRIRDALTESLYLVVEPSGTKSWQMRFRVATGRIGKITLGRVDSSGKEFEGEPQIGQPLTVKAARRLAARVHHERALGRDPIADHRASKHRAKVENAEHSANTFAAAVRAYVHEYARPKTRNWVETARLLGLRYPDDDGEPEESRGGLVARWADRDVHSIDAHDVWTVIDEAKRIGVPGLERRTKGLSDARARALFVALSSVFEWLRGERRVDVNPCRSVPRPANAKVRDRVLNNDEIRWFWSACDSVDAPRWPHAPRPFAPLLRLLLLTGQRLDEVAGMRRDELSADGTLWSLPGNRTKNGRAHVVPLSPLARELIANVRSKTGPAGFLFTTTGRTQVSGWSRAKARLDQTMLAIARQERGPDATIAPWRLHDLRRTCVTGMAELGIRPDVIELCVNHVSGHRGGIAGVYNRSELLPDRRAALERWATHVEALVTGREAEVVHLHPRQGDAA